VKIAAKLFEFASDPDEIEGFAAATRVGSAVRRNRIKPTQQDDHTVYFRNWAPEEVFTTVVSTPDYPRLEYPNCADNRFWPVDLDSVPTEVAIQKVELLGHDAQNCRPGNEHKVTLKGTFRAAHPGARPYRATVTLVLRCN
jgi:hypothetical protein